MSESDPDPKRSEQFLRAVSAKEPGYAELVETLRAAKAVAHEKKIVDHHMREAIREVFGESSP